MAGTKKQYVKVTRPDVSPGVFCVYPIASFAAYDEFDGAEVGDTIVMELCEMTDAEFEALGEFEGW